VTSSAATIQSFNQMIAVVPVLSRIEKLLDIHNELPGHTLFHAGPPFSSPADIPLPVWNSILAAAKFEGWAESEQEIRNKVYADAVSLCPAQDIGLATPLAFVAGPSTWCIEVKDAANPDQRYLSPLNDGPPPKALRFGTGSAAGCDLIQQLGTHIATDLGNHLKAKTALLPLFVDAIKNGDDLHGHLAALQKRLPNMFADGLSIAASEYLQNANQFVLNFVMAAAGLMLQGGANVAHSDMIVACGGNGKDLGYKIGAKPNKWLRQPANPPVGQKFPHALNVDVLPAIGDSALIDALGFGAANLRFCPTLRDALKDKIDPSFFSINAHAAYIGPHPDLPLPGLSIGLDLTRPRECLGIMLGMVASDGKTGLAGRGVSHWT
jgi:hypothetical protein